MPDTVLDKIPSEVVIRHTCHCDGAVVRPEDEADTEHVFTVDGEDFPWLISDRGPLVAQRMTDLYVINVEILLISKGDFKTLAFDYIPKGIESGSSVPFIPVIDGREFPWLLTDDGCTLAFSHKMIPQLTLTFFAHNVDANILIGDQRNTWEERAVYCAGGDTIRVGKDKCFFCDELFDLMEMMDHHKQAHPEHISISKATGEEGYRVS